MVPGPRAVTGGLAEASSDSSASVKSWAPGVVACHTMIRRHLGVGPWAQWERRRRWRSPGVAGKDVEEASRPGGIPPWCGLVGMAATGEVMEEGIKGIWGRAHRGLAQSGQW
jgi:hypothetical protein